MGRHDQDCDRLPPNRHQQRRTCQQTHVEDIFALGKMDTNCDPVRLQKMLNEFHMRTELKQRALFTLKYNLTRLLQIALELMCTIFNNVQNVMISFHLCSSLHQPSNIVITYFTN